MVFNRLIADTGKLFWVLHLGGWLFWGVFIKYLYTTEVLNTEVPHYFAYVMSITFVGIALTLVLRYFYRWVMGKKIWVQIVGFLVGTSAAGYSWLYARSFIYRRFVSEEAEFSEWIQKLGEAGKIYMEVAYVTTLTSAWSVIAAWSALYFGLKYYRVFQEVSESALKSAAMAHEAQLKMLRYQLNPHFLFNTLNAISTLVLEQNTDLANRMVTKLSRFLRFSLDNDPLQKITLEDELEAISLYLSIEKVRFEERLNLEQEIDLGARKALIPSLLLQPLVENAIKYAIARSEDGGTLKITARAFAGDLLLELSDDGPGADLIDGEIAGASGVGLLNTRERLRELYGDQHTFALSQTHPHGLTVSIRLPLET